MRERAPLVWVEPLGMWYATAHAQVRAILAAPDLFITASVASTIFDTFGAHMLTLDGADQGRQKKPFRSAFSRERVSRHVAPAVNALADGLIDGFADKGEAELRAAFASRLPIQVILMVFGMSLEQETRLRDWYDSFELALANFIGDGEIAAAGRRDAALFRTLIADEIAPVRRRPTGGLLSEVVHARQAERLTDEEIAANAQIIFFGGISTVEALILDALWALALDPAATASVRREPERLGAAIEETVRWAGPVQSATRHAARDIDLHGVAIGSGEIVNCILAAANRDPVMFAEPDRFDISRPNAADQVGFGAGPHFCLGAHLAKVEATIALGRLFSRLPDFRVDLARSEAPSGYEFRQPRRLMATWER